MTDILGVLGVGRGQRKRWRHPFEPPPALADGWYLTTAALAHGLDIMLLPRQLMVATPPGGQQVGIAGGDGLPSLSYSKGVPGSSTLAGVTYALDKRMVRVLLQFAKITPTRGSTFHFGAPEKAEQYAAGLGYPVAIRLATDFNSMSRPIVINGPHEFYTAVDQLRRMPTDRGTNAASHIRAPYALTDFTHDEDAEEREFPSAARFLVQKWDRGPVLRTLISRHAVLAAILVDPATQAVRDVTGTCPAGLTQRATNAARAIPGLAVAHVEMLLGRSGEEARPKDCPIVDVLERPRLDLFATEDSGLPHRLATDLLHAEATAHGVALTTYRRRVGLSIRFESVHEPHRFVADLEGAAKKRARVRLELAVADEQEGVVEGRARGRPADIAGLLEAAMAGVITESSPVVTGANHI